MLLIACYVEFEERAGMMDKSGAKSTAYDIVKAYVDSKLGKFTSADVVANCPSIGRSSVFAAIKKLLQEGYIEKHGMRNQAYYVKHESEKWQVSKKRN